MFDHLLVASNCYCLTPIARSCWKQEARFCYAQTGRYMIDVREFQSRPRRTSTIGSATNRWPGHAPLHVSRGKHTVGVHSQQNKVGMMVVFPGWCTKLIVVTLGIIASGSLILGPNPRAVEERPVTCAHCGATVGLQRRFITSRVKPRYVAHELSPYMQN